eukprot:3941266-Rhodomonas_salina.2
MFSTGTGYTTQSLCDVRYLHMLCCVMSGTDGGYAATRGWEAAMGKKPRRYQPTRGCAMSRTEIV